MKVRKRKLCEAAAVTAQLLRVYEMVSAVEWEAEQMEVLGALGRGKEALRAMHEQMSVDDVLELMDDIQDQGEVNARINEAFSQGGVVDAADEAELEEELEALERGMGVGGGEELEMPEAPTAKPAALPEAPTFDPGGREEVRGEEEAKVAVPS